MPDIPPPQKRYAIELNINYHDGDHLADMLRRLASDAELDGRFSQPGSGCSSMGEDYRVIERPDWTPASEYDDALIEWHKKVRAQRRSEAGRAS